MAKHLLLEIASKVKTHEVLLQQARDLSSKIKVLRDARRTEVRSAERAKQKAANSKKLKIKNKTKAKSTKKPCIAKRPEPGRSEQWPGKCIRCIYKFVMKAGGPGHATKQRCAATALWIKRNGKRGTRKRPSPGYSEQSLYK